jgi:hypothetical protein
MPVDDCYKALAVLLQSSSGSFRSKHMQLFLSETEPVNWNSQKTMTEELQGRQKKRWALWIALATVVVLLAVLIVPPLVSVSRYKSRITQLLSASLGRPVRLSSVELRLLPRPGFVLTDLTVEEDPAYGAEPLLHANTVTASIRLRTLWRGHLEIGRISVDDASLNLVRTAAGRWNLDTLFRTAARHAGSEPGGTGGDKTVRLPYLEATNSRINLMEGTEKLPFSLLNTDLSLWQQQPGEWRVRLRGQPARTDVSLDLADTGIVRLEGNVRPASELRRMPLHLDVVWREAQLGQLARLVIGSDPGWRGALTGELHIDGTAEAAQVKARLRAEGVHREEFAPATTMDFDANCGLVYHFTSRALEDLSCDSPLGNGRIHLAGSMPGNGGSPHLSMELFRIPVAAGLDALRTIRSGFGNGLEAKGTVSGKVTYAAVSSDVALPPKRVGHGRNSVLKNRQAARGPLAGSFIVEGFRLGGSGLTTPIQIAKVVLEPVAALQGQQNQGQQNQGQALAATLVIPSGGSGPLTITTRLALSGYAVTVRGQASIGRGRELAHAAGVPDVAGLDALAGDPVAIDLSAEGPWRPEQPIPFSDPSIPGLGPTGSADATTTDRVSGTVTLKNANWKADYLANRVQISQAVLHFGNGGMRWDPVVFTYGPIEGTARLSLPPACISPAPCPASFQVRFGALDAATLQAAILGAHQSGTLLSTLISRLRPATAPSWPLLDGTVKADSLILGPVTLHGVSAVLRITESGAEISGLEAGLLGGRMEGTGTIHTPGNNQDKPAYALTGHLEKLSPQAVGQLLGLRWTGGTIDGDGTVALAGFSDKDLAASAKGNLHFASRRGVVAAGSGSEAVPLALARFDRWAADAEIGDGKIVLKQNQVQQGVRKRAVDATVTLSDPAKVTFPSSKTVAAKR